LRKFIIILSCWKLTETLRRSDRAATVLRGAAFAPTVEARSALTYRTFLSIQVPQAAELFPGGDFSREVVVVGGTAQNRTPEQSLPPSEPTNSVGTAVCSLAAAVDRKGKFANRTVASTNGTIAVTRRCRP
jgi:hypothetical protein